MTSQAEATVPVVAEPANNDSGSISTRNTQDSSAASAEFEAQPQSQAPFQPPAATDSLLQPPTNDPPPPFESLPAAIPASPTPSAAPSILSNRVTVRVGEKEFFTTRPTLAESRLFTGLFAAQPQRTDFFVDDEPELFAQVLRYLRTRRYPLYYTRSEGHDHIRYMELLSAARFYQVDALTAWLVDKRYQGAVWLKTNYKGATLYGQDQVHHMQELAWANHEHGRILQISDKQSKAWQCPAKLWRHDGHEWRCAKAKCTRPDAAGLSTGAHVSMRVVEVKALVTSVEIREDALLAEPSPEVPPPYQN